MKSVANSETNCPIGERFYEDDLERIVRNDMMEKLHLLMDADDRYQKAATGMDGTEENLRFRLEQTEKRLKQISVSGVCVYERYAEDKLQRDMYPMERDKLNAEVDMLTADKQHLEQELIPLSRSQNRELRETAD